MGSDTCIHLTLMGSDSCIHLTLRAVTNCDLALACGVCRTYCWCSPALSSHAWNIKVPTLGILYVAFSGVIRWRVGAHALKEKWTQRLTKPPLELRSKRVFGVQQYKQHERLKQLFRVERTNIDKAKDLSTRLWWFTSVVISIVNCACIFKAPGTSLSSYGFSWSFSHILFSWMVCYFARKKGVPLLCPVLAPSRSQILRNQPSVLLHLQKSSWFGSGNRLCLACIKLHSALQ